MCIPIVVLKYSQKVGKNCRYCKINDAIMDDTIIGTINILKNCKLLTFVYHILIENPCALQQIIHKDDNNMRTF